MVSPRISIGNSIRKRHTTECQWTIRCKRDYIEIDKNKIEELQDRLKSEGLEIHISRSQLNGKNQRNGEV